MSECTALSICEVNLKELDTDAKDNLPWSLNDGVVGRLGWSFS